MRMVRMARTIMAILRGVLVWGWERERERGRAVEECMDSGEKEEDGVGVSGSGWWC